MAFSYPRKKTLLIFIVCVLAVGGVAYYRTPKSQADEILSNAISVKPSNSPIPLTVTDNNTNGIPDWQEQFSGETLVQIDPYLDAPATASEEKNLTLTAKLGRDFFTQYVNLKQGGVFDDSDTVTRSMQALVDTAVDSESPVLYKLSSIREIQNKDAATLRTWTSSVSKSFDTFTWTKNEAMLANEALSREDPAILKKISPIISGYTKIIASLRAIPTPEPLSLPMLDLINAVSTLKYSAQAMQSFDKDPLKGTIGVKAYSEGTQALIRALQEISEIVEQEGIVFEMNGIVFSTLQGY